MNESESNFNYDEPIFEKIFTPTDNSSCNFFEKSLHNTEELKKMMDTKPFFEGRDHKKLDNFLSLANACMDLAMFENAEFSICTDEKDTILFFIIGKDFYFEHAQMVLMLKINLYAHDIVISATVDKEHSSISVGFDFSQNKYVLLIL